MGERCEQCGTVFSAGDGPCPTCAASPAGELELDWGDRRRGARAPEPSSTPEIPGAVEPQPPAASSEPGPRLETANFALMVRAADILLLLGSVAEFVSAALSLSGAGLRWLGAATSDAYLLSNNRGAVLVVVATMSVWWTAAVLQVLRPGAGLVPRVVVMWLAPFLPRARAQWAALTSGFSTPPAAVWLVPTGLGVALFGWVGWTFTVRLAHLPVKPSGLLLEAGFALAAGLSFFRLRLLMRRFHAECSLELLADAPASPSAAEAHTVCPACNASVPVAARSCAHCGVRQVFDVSTSPVVSERVRGELSSAIGALGLPHLDATVAFAQLKGPAPMVVRRLPRQAALRLLEELRSFGREGAMTLSAPPRRTLALVFAAIAVLVLGAAVVFGFSSARPAAPPEVATRPGPAATPPGPPRPVPAPVRRPERTEPAPTGQKYELDQVRRAVVFIRNSSPAGTSVGSGFLVSDDGLVYTNRHVVQGEGLVRPKLWVGVASSDPDRLDYFRAELVYTTPPEAPLDFAALKISARDGYGPFHVVSRRAEPPQLGEEVAVLGYPFITEEQAVLSFNKGNVSATRVDFDGQPYLQTDAAINPGNSGGPLINTRGEVIGLVTLKKANADNLGYALPLKELAPLEELVRQRAAAIAPQPGPVAVEAMIERGRVPARESEWERTRANVEQGRGALSLHLLGGVYWVTSKQPLPRNFQLTIPCQVEFMKGSQVIFETQRPMLRSLFVRWAAADTNREISEADGYTFRFSHSSLVLMKNGYQNAVAAARVGNPTDPFVMIITRQDDVITFGVDGQELLKWKDPQPLAPGGKFSIGGYLSALTIGDVTVSDLDAP